MGWYTDAPRNTPGERFIISEQCRRLRDRIAADEDVTEELKDFTCALRDKAFYDIASLAIPALRGHTDDKLESDNPFIVAICRAAEAWMPVKHGKLMGDSPRVATISKAARTIQGLMVESIDDLSSEGISSMPKIFAPWASEYGIATPSVLEESLAKGQPSDSKPPPPPSDIHKYAKKEADDVATETGLYNGGNTCFQNSVFQLIVRSDRVMGLMQELGGGAVKDKPLANLVYRLLLALKSAPTVTVKEEVRDSAGNKRQVSREVKDFREFTELLRLIWKTLDARYEDDKQIVDDIERQMAEAKAEKKPLHPNFRSDKGTVGQFRAGQARQQDAHEFLVSFILDELAPYFAPAWTLWKRTYYECSFCGPRPTQNQRSMSLSIPLLPNLISQDFAQAMTTEFTTVRIIEKSCDSELCKGRKRQHYSYSNLIPDPSSAGRSLNKKQQNSPELLVRLNRWDPVTFAKDSRVVKIPQLAFPVVGLDQMYYAKVLVTHIGGGSNSGHYCAIARDEIGGEWMEFNDSKLKRKVPWWKVQEEVWYLALLAPIKPADAAGLVQNTAQYKLVECIDAIATAYHVGVPQSILHCVDPNIVRIPVVQELVRLLETIIDGFSADADCALGDSDDEYAGRARLSQREADRIKQDHICHGLAHFARLEPSTKPPPIEFLEGAGGRCFELAICLLRDAWASNRPKDPAAEAADTCRRILASEVLAPMIQGIVADLIQSQFEKLQWRRMAEMKYHDRQALQLLDLPLQGAGSRRRSAVKALTGGAGAAESVPKIPEIENRGDGCDSRDKVKKQEGSLKRTASDPFEIPAEGTQSATKEASSKPRAQALQTGTTASSNEALLSVSTPLHGGQGTTPITAFKAVPHGGSKRRPSPHTPTRQHLKLFSDPPGPDKADLHAVHEDPTTRTSRGAVTIEMPVRESSGSARRHPLSNQLDSQRLYHTPSHMSLVHRPGSITRLAEGAGRFVGTVQGTFQGTRRGTAEAAFDRAWYSSSCKEIPETQRASSSGDELDEHRPELRAGRGRQAR